STLRLGMTTTLRGARGSGMMRSKSGARRRCSWRKRRASAVEERRSVITTSSSSGSHHDAVRQSRTALEAEQVKDLQRQPPGTARVDDETARFGLVAGHARKPVEQAVQWQPTNDRGQAQPERVDRPHDEEAV